MPSEASILGYLTYSQKNWTAAAKRAAAVLADEYPEIPSHIIPEWIRFYDREGVPLMSQRTDQEAVYFATEALRCRGFRVDPYIFEVMGTHLLRNPKADLRDLSKFVQRETRA